MLNTIELSQKYWATKIVHQVLFSDAGGGQGLGLVSGGGRLHGSLGYSGLFLLVVSLALIGPTYKIEASHWLREAKGACFVLPHLLRTVFFFLNQLVQFVFESSGVMTVAQISFGFVPAGFLATRTVSFLSTWSCEDWHKYGDCDLNERRRVIVVGFPNWHVSG